MRWAVTLLLLGSGSLVLAGCSADDCAKNPALGCGPYASGAGADGSGASGGGVAGAGNAGAGNSVGGTAGSGNQAGAGGACGDCSGSTPHCDVESGDCVACLDHTHCPSAQAAKCDGGVCVGCDDSDQCDGNEGGEICDDTECVECTLTQDDACADTCDLLTNTCSSIGVDSLDSCQACTNDDQCQGNMKCVPMDYDDNFHGYFCLEPSPGCIAPYLSLINEPSVNGSPAADYCSPNTTLAACEAVFALEKGWVCSTDGMCSPDGIEPDIAVPSSLCRQIGAAPGQCTYPCSIPNHCPVGLLCGDGPMNAPPNYCGG